MDYENKKNKSVRTPQQERNKDEPLHTSESEKGENTEMFVSLRRETIVGNKPSFYFGHSEIIGLWKRQSIQMHINYTTLASINRLSLDFND